MKLCSDLLQAEKRDPLIAVGGGGGGGGHGWSVVLKGEKLMLDLRESSDEVGVFCLFSFCLFY